MYLSYLLIDTAANANRPRPGRDWIRNPYCVHQRLWMAFPSAGQVKDDPHFLDSFIPEEFQQLSRIDCKQAGLNDKPKPHAPNDGHDHRVRDAANGFLFRIDAVSASSPSRHVTTVQSAVEPDWNYAFHNAPEFLTAKPKVVPFEPSFREGQTLRFRLRANPTKRIRSLSFRPDVDNRRAHWYEKIIHTKNGEQRHPSRRVGITTPDEQVGWFNQKALERGFEVSEFHKSFSERTVNAWKTDHDDPEPNRHRLSMVSALFEGRLIVREADKFHATLLAGIGSAKGLGFGLLSVTER